MRRLLTRLDPAAPLVTVTLESGEVADTTTVPEADLSTGTEITITGNPANCPIPPVGEENCTSICCPAAVGASVVAIPVASPLAPSRPTMAPVPNAVASRVRTKCPLAMAMGFAA
jgi:hypothetical protein